jgi:hypothetical protein
VSSGNHDWPGSVYSTLIISVFGVLVPFFIFKLARLIGFTPLLALTIFTGLAYGAVKAEYTWYGNGIVGNATLMLASALVLVAYVALSYGGASFVGRMASLFRP